MASQLHRLAEWPLLLVWGLRDFVFDGHFRPFGYGLCAEAALERWPELAGE